MLIHLDLEKNMRVNYLFESAKKYLKEHLGERKTLNISKGKSEIGTLRKEKDILYSQMTDIRKEVEQAESVRGCIDKLLQEKRGKEERVRGIKFE